MISMIWSSSPKLGIQLRDAINEPDSIAEREFPVVLEGTNGS
jgi:hypothetical protein